MSHPPAQRQDQFLRLFMACEQALRAFVRSLVPTLNDSNDIMQEVAVVLWEKFAADQTAEDFRRWAFGVSKFKVLAWQRDRMRDRHVFGLETTELLAAEAEEHALRLEIQREVLGKCLQQLTAEQRSLLENAYAPAARIDTLAEQKGLTPMTLYKKLHRLRLLLAECTRRAFELKNDL